MDEYTLGARVRTVAPIDRRVLLCTADHFDVKAPSGKMSRQVPRYLCAAPALRVKELLHDQQPRMRRASSMPRN